MNTDDQGRSRDALSNPQRAVQAAVLGTLLGLPVAATASEPTVSVVESVQLGASASRIWGAIADFGAWPSWHPAFAGTQMLQGDGHSKGAVRALVTQDGGKFTEELVDFDAAARSYQYRIIESPAPVFDYVSTIRVQETATGSTVVWSSHFKVKAGTSEADAKRLISAVYRAGLDNLAAVIE